MHIRIVYDASVAKAPAAFKAVVNSVVHFYESAFNDPVTVSIAVGYGEVAGHALNRGALGESSYYLDGFSYAAVQTALTSNASSADDVTAAASLPLVSPLTGDVWLSQAQAKAIGLLVDSSSLDGHIGFATSNMFNYGRSHGISAGHYDFYGAVAHEISEVMGRFLLTGGALGATPHAYSLLDLFHYSSPANRDFAGTQPGYFSINSGLTNLDSFNTNPRGDFGDWAASAGRDAFRAFAPASVVNAVSETDLREMNILGWDRTGSSVTVTAGSVGFAAHASAAGMGAQHHAGWSWAEAPHHFSGIGAGEHFVHPSTHELYTSDLLLA